jgi:hypothetical protein
MKDLFKLILGVLASLFKSRAALAISHIRNCPPEELATDILHRSSVSQRISAHFAEGNQGTSCRVRQQ